MKNFWLQFAITEGSAVASAFLASNTTMSPQLKKALEDLIAAGQEVTLALHKG